MSRFTESEKKRNKILWIVMPVSLSILVICLGLMIQFGYLNHMKQETCDIISCNTSPNVCITYLLKYEGKKHYSYECTVYAASICNQTTVPCYYDYNDSTGNFKLSLYPIQTEGFIGIIILSVLTGVAFLFNCMFGIAACICRDEIQVNTSQEQMDELHEPVEEVKTEDNASTKATHER